MKAINIKLFRDLKNTRAQAFTIIMVMTAGISTFVMSLSTLDSLKLTRDAYYLDYRFAEVFASAKRAPESLALRIAAIDGVDKVETRVIAGAKLSVEGFTDPINAMVVSLPDFGEAAVNRLYIREGRLLDSGRDDEVILNEVFAEAHGLLPDDHIEIIIKGRQKKLRVVGIALSPEFIYQVAPGAIMPDNKRYAVMWMAREALAKAYEMDGAFNDVVLTTTVAASIDDIIQHVDLLLEKYGGQDARGREWQTSHRFLNSEFEQLEQMASTFSTIFLAVAAFLLNVVVGRMISSQREQIAALKAFGYSNIDIGLHYLGYVTLIVIIGLLLGIGAGIWLGHGLSEVYMEYYRFPWLNYELSGEVIALATVVTGFAALAGTLFAVRQAIKLPPAEAMRPEPPANFKETLMERIGLKTLFSQPTRMILRHIERKPVKASLSVIGIALACSIMVVGIFFRDAIDFMVDIEFGLAQRQDITVTFVEPTSLRAFYNLLRLPGVEHAEVFRSVPVRLRNGHLSYRTGINAYQKKRDLYRTLNTEHIPIEMPEQGLALTEYLAKVLNVKPGDEITVEVLEGRRPKLRIPVSDLITQYIGVGAYMDINALNRMMREDSAISGVYLKVDKNYLDEIYRELNDMPRVASSAARMNVISSFYDTMAEFILIYVGFISTLAGIITFGVVYNSARIALAERSRELASMRVLGFTRGEISYILLGELAILTLLAIPVGLLIGRVLCWYMIQNIPQDVFRVPLIIEPNTYALSAAVVIIASVLSSLAVRSRLDHLDLIAVLKTKE
jgi:putative ABC transport system permease protein